jgi:hypothetical protein
VSRHSINNTSGGKEQAEDRERTALDRECDAIINPPNRAGESPLHRKCSTTRGLVAMGALPPYGAAIVRRGNERS